MNKKQYLYSNLFAWGLVLFLITNYIFGWTTPTEDPPGGNIVLETGATPAGSTGYIQFNDDGNLGADSSLFWDNSNKRLGIGTTGPGYKLDVSGNARITTNLGVGTTPNSSYAINAAGGTYGIWATGSTMGGSFIDSDGTSATFVAHGSYGIYTEQTGRFGAGNFNGTVNLNSNKITNLATPTASADAATKGYVDSVAGGCPSGFNDTGYGYCIQNNENSARTWYAASDYCADTYGARLCTSSEWYNACVNNKAIYMTGNWEWVDSWYSVNCALIRGVSSCTSVNDDNAANYSNAFRCCK